MPRGTRTSPKFAPGTLVADRYRLVQYLARGGMAEVWLATHESLKSEVAIKFIDQLIAQDHAGALDRFRFEAQVSARLSARTKHVVAVHDAGEHAGIPFLVMEFVPGRTLEREIEENGPIDPARFADLLDQTADALSVAHDLGIVHRDLKPSNLMLVDVPDGSKLLKITDFGIAKAMRGDVPLDRPKETALGEMIGSPAYMSPEQIDGRKDLDARSDLWSLGVLSYEAITGQACFGRGASMTQLLVAISTLQYTPPSQLRSGLPKAVDEWFARVLAVKAQDRFDSVAEMARAFRAALESPRAEPRGPGRIIAASALLITAAVIVALLALRSLKNEPSENAVSTTTSKPTVSAVVLPPPLPLPPPVALSSDTLTTSFPAAPPAPSPKALPTFRAKPTATASVDPQTPKKTFDESEKQ
jgi:eukaryotic-like serine/threonine-protein kinase